MREIDKSHPVSLAWARVTRRLRAAIAQRGVHPSKVVVLVPYAQLIQQARAAWLAHSEASANGAGFLPRFESTMNWARASPGFAPGGDDLRLDAAFDLLTARHLLHRAGLGPHAAVLAPQLMEAAWSLAAVAGAQTPKRRSDWGAALSNTVLPDAPEPALAFEVAIGRIALAWASSSSFAQDGLFETYPGLLVVIEGFQAEPLVEALVSRLEATEPGCCQRLALFESTDAPSGHSLTPGPGAALHEADDFEDEAERAAACVLRHLSEGRSPVGLVALDRQLTRRVRALLGERGVVIRDETGWKLSTTRAAATLMGSLDACRWDASSDEVLDWLKNAPVFVDWHPSPSEDHSFGVDGASSPESSLQVARAFTPLAQLEQALRRLGLRDWPSDKTQLSLSGFSLPAQQVVERANLWRAQMTKGRSLSQWLLSLAELLEHAGQWRVLMADAAGRAVAAALGLPTEPRANEDWPAASPWHDFAPAGTRLSAAEFTSWVGQTLEAASYSPTHPNREQVVILPLAQLLGRPLAAVVLAGCDERRFPMSPDVPGVWTAAQRVALGLPAREAIARALAQSWHYALHFSHLDIVWRASEGGERLLPSGFVQALRHWPGRPGSSRDAPDPRGRREMPAQPSGMPQPSGQALALQRLSASAYDDLRKCPYRFFALRQLELAEADELDVEVGKRDFGNWLHKTLFHFHNALTTSGAIAREGQEMLMAQAAQKATADLGLSAAEFLPFAAAWPKARAGYLDWLEGHLADGHAFVEGEAWKEMRLGDITLVGKLDRVDRDAKASCLVIDYKTESRAATSERIKSGNEDTQLAFYAALIDVDNIRAAYVNVSEKEGTKPFPQLDIVALRGQLAEGILDDMQRVNDGDGLPALGEGLACDFCAARGLCRKDFWT